MNTHDRRVEADIERLRAEIASALAAGKHGRAVDAYHDLRLAVLARRPQEIERMEHERGLR